MKQTIFIETAVHAFMIGHVSIVEADDKALACDLTYSELKALGMLIHLPRFLIKRKYDYLWLVAEQIFLNAPFGVLNVVLTVTNNILIIADGQQSDRIYNKWKLRYANYFKGHDVDLVWV